MSRETLATLQRAADALGRADPATAESLCRDLLAADADQVDALNLLSLARKQRGDFADAERLMRKALETDPRRPDIHGNLANLYRSQGQFADAEQAYRQALRIANGFRPARLGLAKLLLDLGRAGEALEEARRLLRRDSQDAEALNVSGSACRDLGRNSEAEQAFRRALATAPGYAVARHNLGALLASESRSEEALEELDRAAAGGVTGPEISHNRASTLMTLGRLDEAEGVLADAIVAAPGAIAVHSLLARIRYMRGDERFARSMTAALAADPDNAGLRVACARALGGAGQHDQAIEVLEGGLSRNDSEPRVLAEASAVLHRRGDFEEALRLAREAVALAPAEPSLNDLVIQALLSLGDGAEAMPLIDAARRRVPLNQYYVALEATAARLLGDPRFEALYDYERFVQSYTLPVPAGRGSIGEFHEELVPALNARHRFVAPPLDQSLRGGTQTPRGLLNDPEPAIQAFLEAVRAPVAAYCAQLGRDADHPFTARNNGSARLSGCWSVRLRRDGFHVNHVHSEGWISSAYYVELPEEVSDRQAQSGWLKFGEPGFHVPGAQPGKILQPQVGMLVLFPSYMWHGTTPIHGDEVRLTIAFDAVPGEKKGR